MSPEEIIRRNKSKRNNYVTNNSDNKDQKVKYLRGLISRILITIIFILGSIIFTNLSENNENFYKKNVLENSIEFTKINNLYQKVFGNVDIINTNENTKTVFSGGIEYSNIENFKNGVKLTVNMNEPINIITSGIVVFIGDKEGLGNTVIIQGNDGVDIWYSNITDTNIKIYDYVESGSILGTSNSDYIYLTINKDGKYITYEEYQKNI